MNPTDELSSYYAELLEGTYDCVDRVVFNAYFPMGQTGGGAPHVVAATPRQRREPQ
jgi:hypothetical protein